MTTITLTLNGWAHVHRWRESHGNGGCDTYQQERAGPFYFTQGRVNLLQVYFDRDGATTTVLTEVSTHDYLKARFIRANPEIFTPTGERSVSPCFTSGYDDFIDASDDVWRIFGAAGHGEYAFRLSDAEAKAVRA